MVEQVEPRRRSVQCVSAAGLHRMAYREWGDPRNRDVLVCVHGLTRSSRDFDELAFTGRQTFDGRVRRNG